MYLPGPHSSGWHLLRARTEYFPTPLGAVSKYLLVTGDASCSDLGVFPAVLIVSQPHPGEQVQKKGHEIPLQEAWCSAREVVWPWQDLGLELERLRFQHSSATINLCDPGQVTEFLQF